MNITVNSIKVNYTDEGSGSPVLFLHGWASSIIPFTRLINTLKPTHRVIAVDFPGCGESDTMQEPWDIDDYCDFVLEFLRLIDVKDPVLIGHSHGGRVIMKLVGDGRILPPKIIFLDAAGLIPKKKLKQKIKAKSYKIIKGVLTLPVIRNHSGKLLERARNHFGSKDYNSAPGVLRKTLVNVVNVDLRHLLPNIKCPTLLIWGENDTATPLSDAKIIESLIKDSGLCVIKGGGHFSFLDSPYEACAILKSFLG